MLERISEGFDVFKQSFKFTLKHPILLIPMLLAGAAVIYYRIWFQNNYVIENMTTQEILFSLYIYTVVVTFSISIASLIVLEFVEQIEKVGRANIFVAMFDALTRDLIRALPIMIVWSFIKFILLLLELLVSASNDDDNRSYRSRRAERRTRSFITTLKTGIRMSVMTMFCAIAWEPIGPFKAAKKGIDVYRGKFSHLGTGVALSRFLTLVTMLPLLLVFIFFGYAESISPNFIYGVMVYFGLTWAFSMIIEQIYVAELYLWYKTYIRAKTTTTYDENFEIKTMHDVKKPSLFDNTQDLN